MENPPPEGSFEDRLAQVEQGLQDVILSTHEIIAWIRGVGRLPIPPCPPECLAHQDHEHQYGGEPSSKNT